MNYHALLLACIRLYTRIKIHLSSFCFHVMPDEIAPYVSMVSRDLCEIFHQRSFLKEGDCEIGTLILKRQIKIYGKLLGKVYYSVTSLISLTHCKVGSLRSWPDLIVCTRLMDSVVRCLIGH